MEVKVKKILFFTKSEAYGGIEKVLLDYCNNLDSTKYDITVLNWFMCDEIKDKLNGNIKYKYIFKNKEIRGVGRFVKYFPEELVHRVFIRDKYDVEIAFQEGYTHKIISGANKNTKKIAWFHINPNYFNFNLPLCKNEEKLEKILKKYDELCYVSKFMKKWYVNKYYLEDSKLEVVYNPINKEDIIKKSKEDIKDIKLSNDVFRIICVGRLSVEKRFDHVIEACNKIYNNNYKNIELIIVGDGPEKENLNSLINKFNAQSYIKLIGFNSNPYKYIDKSNLLVCSSDNIESFGLVVAEAMVLNIPVLSVKCGGPDEILDNGKYGMIVESNKEAIYLGILKLIEDKKLYNKYINVNKDILKEFELKKIINKFETLIK